MTLDLIALPPAAPRAAAQTPPPTEEMRAAGRAFESVFLAEMLKHTGLARPPEAYGGGAGEAQFAPMLVRAYADALAERGGVGLGARIADELARR